MDAETLDTLIRTMAGDIRVIRSKAEELTAHQLVANGRLGKLEETQILAAVHTAKLDGAISLGRWAFGAMLAIMSVGAGLAGVILTIMARGGH